MSRLNVPTSPSKLARCLGTTQNERANLLRYLGSMLLWAVVYTACNQLIKREIVTSPALTWIVATIGALMGLVVIFAYRRLLRGGDELQRLIHLQALALAFGGTFFAFAGYRIFERLGAPLPDTSDFGLVMAILYTIAILFCTWRYS